jgi:hypothetical protein
MDPFGSFLSLCMNGIGISLILPSHNNSTISILIFGNMREHNEVIEI